LVTFNSRKILALVINNENINKVEKYALSFYILLNRSTPIRDINAAVLQARPPRRCRTGNSKVCWLNGPITPAVNSKKPFIISTFICKTVRGQNDPTLGVDVLRNTLDVRELNKNLAKLNLEGMT
jgi:hypothetical protein